MASATLRRGILDTGPGALSWVKLNTPCEGRKIDMRLNGLVLALVLFSFAIGSHVQAGGNIEAGKSLALACAACHGQDGSQGLMPNYPKLAGQNEKYLLDQLHMIQSGERVAPLMAGQLNGKSSQQLSDLAAYFASLPGFKGVSTDDKLTLGESIYRGGIMEKGVSACTACHSPSGVGNNLAGFPRVAGQSQEYLVEQLTRYREGTRATDEKTGGMMRQIAGGLTDGEIQALANYIQGLQMSGE
ncbi:MAG: cytochrome c4 [Pseudomonadales bacterium]|nr:cytochrome c4 [Pseudomonadales bacterium]